MRTIAKTCMKIQREKTMLMGIFVHKKMHTKVKILKEWRMLGKKNNMVLHLNRQQEQAHVTSIMHNLILVLEVFEFQN